jgi:hypothetical protein
MSPADSRHASAGSRYRRRLEVEVDADRDRAIAMRLYTDAGGAVELPIGQEPPSVLLLAAAKAHPDAALCWFDSGLGERCSPPSSWPGLLRHRLEMRFFPGPPGDGSRLATLAVAASYSPFLMPARNPDVTPSWLVSPISGVCDAGLLACFELTGDRWSLRQLLSAVARESMLVGGCAYADARLLRDGSAAPPPMDAPWREVAGLVAQHGGPKAPLLWVLGVSLMRRGFPLLSALAAMGQRGKLAMDRQRLATLRPPHPRPPATTRVDAVIPTLHRPDHLRRILEDLSAQSHLPTRVQVVAQGADSVPRDLEQRPWRFALNVEKVAWIGACRARNAGIADAESEWVLLVDDDVRLPPDYIERMLSLAMAYCVDAVNAIPFKTQVLGIDAAATEWTWSNFLSGFALCRRDKLLASGGFQPLMEGIIFEDYELGVRLRRTGTHVIVTRSIEVENLGAPTGGFRSPEIAEVRPRGRELPPGLAVFFSLYDQLPRAMRLGFMLYYPRAMLRSQPWWRWPSTLLRLRADWRATRRWFMTGAGGYG